MIRCVGRVVLEWTGDAKSQLRSAVIELQRDDTRCSLVMTSHGGCVLRTIDLLRHDKLMIWLSSDKHRNHLLIHVPREYDLVNSTLLCYNTRILFSKTCSSGSDGELEQEFGSD